MGGESGEAETEGGAEGFVEEAVVELQPGGEAAVGTRWRRNEIGIGIGIGSGSGMVGGVLG